MENNIPYMEAQIIKYVTRWRKKNGMQDLEKAKHFLEKLMEYESSNPILERLRTINPRRLELLGGTSLSEEERRELDLLQREAMNLLDQLGEPSSLIEDMEQLRKWLPQDVDGSIYTEVEKRRRCPQCSLFLDNGVCDKCGPVDLQDPGDHVRMMHNNIMGNK